MVWWHGAVQLFLIVLAIAIVGWNLSALWQRVFLILLTAQLSLAFVSCIAAKTTWLHSFWDGLIFYKRDEKPWLYWSVMALHGLGVGLSGTLLVASLAMDSQA